jgi:hypothetical protein
MVKENLNPEHRLPFFIVTNSPANAFHIKKTPPFYRGQSFQKPKTKHPV